MFKVKIRNPSAKIKTALNSVPKELLGIIFFYAVRFLGNKMGMGTKVEIGIFWDKTAKASTTRWQTLSKCHTVKIIIIVNIQHGRNCQNGEILSISFKYRRAKH